MIEPGLHFDNIYNDSGCSEQSNLPLSVKQTLDKIRWNKWWNKWEDELVDWWIGGWVDSWVVEKVPGQNSCKAVKIIN